MSNGTRWTEDDIAWLNTLYPTEPLALVAFTLGRRNKVVNTAARNRGIEKIALEHQPFTPDHDAWIAALYPDNYAADVAFAIGRATGAVHRRAAKLGIKKSAEFLANELAAQGARLTHEGAAHRFPKGHVPANKGRFGWHPPGCEKGWFKKGHQRNDTSAIGAERICKKDGIVLIKVTREEQGSKALQWQPKNRVLWARANGPIPDGMVLRCIDGNKHNCDPSNWRLITKAENMRGNTIHNYPKPIAQAVLLRGAINRRINGLKRKQDTHQRHD